MLAPEKNGQSFSEAARIRVRKARVEQGASVQQQAVVLGCKEHQNTLVVIVYFQGLVLWLRILSVNSFDLEEIVHFCLLCHQLLHLLFSQILFEGLDSADLIVCILSDPFQASSRISGHPRAVQVVVKVFVGLLSESAAKLQLRVFSRVRMLEGRSIERRRKELLLVHYLQVVLRNLIAKGELQE